MLLDSKQQQPKGETKKSGASLGNSAQNNLPMEFALSTCYILSATLLVVEARQLPTMNE